MKSLLLPCLLLVISARAEISSKTNLPVQEQGGQQIKTKIDLPIHQQEAVQKLRTMMGDKLYLPYMRTDHFLLRWLEHHSFDLSATEAKLNKALTWRKDQNIDNILSESNPFVDSHMKWGISARDHLGGPVMTVEMGNWDVRRVAVAGKIDDVTRNLIRLIETAMADIVETGKTKPNVNQWVVLANFQGFSLVKHGCPRCIQVYLGFISHYENYYPGSASDFIVVNTPRSFDSILTLLRGVMSPGMKRAHKVYGTNQEEWEFLDTVIPKDQLPPRLGGTKKGLRKPKINSL